MAIVADRLSTYLSAYREAHHCYVAYSGGLDSHVLLHSVTALLGAQNVTAIHVNHQLSDYAASWQQHCEKQCEQIGVALQSFDVSVEIGGKSPEQAAREARYRVFESVLEVNDLLLMAHHADDQVETVLYRLLRGSGVKGLAGMPVKRPLGKGELLRPLLSLTRGDLEAYASQHSLSSITDESNFSIDFDRNFLRHKVIPAIATRWPDYTQRVAHSAELCRESSTLLENVARGDFERLDPRRERCGWSIAMPELLDSTPQRRAEIVRYWTGLMGLSVPGHRVIETIERELLRARQDAMPLVVWGDTQLRRYRERLYLMAKNSLPESVEIKAQQWSLKEPLNLAAGKLTAETVVGQGLRVTENIVIDICYRRGGERCKPAGRSGSNTLKKLLQNVALEPWLRDFVPLIYIDGNLAAVADLWVCEGYHAAPSEQGWLLQWQFDHS
jgi:tRNA(Ile)-lysidine synthase